MLLPLHLRLDILSRGLHAVQPGFRFDKHAEDVKEAKRLLAEAGYPDGFETTITFRKVGSYPDFSANNSAALEGNRR